MNQTIACFFVAVVLCACSARTKGVGPSAMQLAANNFLKSLSPEQKNKARFPFADEERFRWNYVPIERKGIPLKELSEPQHKAAMDLLKTALSDNGYQKTSAIIELENVLIAVENRSAGDHYRDPGKYYLSLFGDPTRDSLWGWRFEGHHVSFNFTSNGEGLVSGTPGFLGANPAVVQAGPQKGKEVLHDETAAGFALLHSLSEAQKKKALIASTAPGEIITGASRKAVLQSIDGILYNELNEGQQSALRAMLHLYLYRYKEPFAAQMMKDIEAAGLNKLRFAWAGDEQPGIGHPHYYRILGPTVLIEYDNTQNNANHVHTVVRDLENDFGDELLEHYQQHQH